MPRSVRVEYPGAIYHVMARGNDGQEIFLADDGRRLFMASLEDICGRTGWLIHCYVLMSNHYHLLLETPEANLVAGMKWLQGAYTQRFNAMFRRRGHLFQGRYKAIPVQGESDPEYFLRLSSYIHLNPFRAGLYGEGLEQPLHAYSWSSFPFYAGLSRRQPAWLVVDRVLNGLGLDPGEQGSRRCYRAMLEEAMRARLDSGTLRAEAEAQERTLRRGWYLGDRDFQMELLDRIGTPSDSLRGAQRIEKREHDAESVLAEGCKLLGLDVGDVPSMKQSQPEKQALLWMLRKRTSATFVWIAGRLGMRHRASAYRALADFEGAADGVRVELKNKLQQWTG